MTAETYRFPTGRLRTRLAEPGRTPLALVACGSFSPITFLHLRMFSLAFDFIRFNTNYEVVGSYLSPVSDHYKKQGLAPAHHRLKMAELACRTSDTIMVDPWEALQPTYTTTAKVLDHFDEEINKALGGGIDVECETNGDADDHSHEENGVEEEGEGGNGVAAANHEASSADSAAATTDGTVGHKKKRRKKKRVRVALLAGADLIETMAVPGLWAPEDIHHILVKYGAFIIERAGTNIEQAMATLKPDEVRGVHYIRQVISNDVSSTKVRQLLKSDMSIDYLIPHEVVKYIKEHGLYQ